MLEPCQPMERSLRSNIFCILPERSSNVVYVGTKCNPPGISFQARLMPGGLRFVSRFAPPLRGQRHLVTLGGNERSEQRSEPNFRPAINTGLKAKRDRKLCSDGSPRNVATRRSLSPLVCRPPSPKGCKTRKDSKHNFNSKHCLFVGFGVEVVYGRN